MEKTGAGLWIGYLFLGAPKRDPAQMSKVGVDSVAGHIVLKGMPGWREGRHVGLAPTSVGHHCSAHTLSHLVLVNFLSAECSFSWVKLKAPGLGGRGGLRVMGWVHHKFRGCEPPQGSCYPPRASLGPYFTCWNFLLLLLFSLVSTFSALNVYSYKLNIL